MTTTTTTQAPTVVQDLRSLEDLRTRAGISGAAAVRVYMAVKVDRSIGTRELARQAGCSPANVTAWSNAGWIIDRLEGLAEAYVGSVLEVRALAVFLGSKVIESADTASDTPEGFWLALQRAKADKTAAKADKTEEAPEDTEPKGGAKGGEETPLTAWDAALKAITRALEVTKDDSGNGLTIAMADKVAEAGAVMVQGLEIAETVRKNLDKTDRQVTDGGKSVVKAGN